MANLLVSDSSAASTSMANFTCDPVAPEDLYPSSAVLLSSFLNLNLEDDENPCRVVFIGNYIPYIFICFY